MRAVLTLLFVFGAIAVVYAIYWARRAASAAADANALYRQTGSWTETAKQLYARQSLPDLIRLSVNQQQYIDQNFNDFMELHAKAAAAQRDLFVARFVEQERAANRPLTGEQRDEIFERAQHFCFAQHAKTYCEVRGVI